MTKKKKTDKKLVRSTDFEKVLLFGPSGSGATQVTAETAHTISSVFCAITMISTAIAKMPLHVYKNLKDGGKERDVKSKEYQLLSRRPHRRITPFEFKEMIIGHLLLRGNFYAQIVRDGRGEAVELIPLHPARVQATWRKDKNGNITDEMVYLYTDSANKKHAFTEDMVLHIRGPMSDGVTGKSVISMGAQGLSRNLLVDGYVTDFYQNGSAPLGILKHPEALSPTATERIRDDWEKIHKGQGNRHKLAVLEEGLEWQNVGISNQDAQLIQIRFFEVEEVARWFNIQPHKLKHLLRSTFSNIEHQNQEFYDDTVMPWVKRIQDAINMVFFAEETDRFCEFLFDSILITDTQTRYQAHALAINGGWKTRNEVRKIENLNPLPGLDDVLVPLNMTEEGKDEEPAVIQPKNAPKDEGDSNEDEELSSSRLVQAFIPTFMSAIKRSLRREEKGGSEEKLTQELKRDLEPFFRTFLSVVVAENGTRSDCNNQVLGICEEFALGYVERKKNKPIDERETSELKAVTELLLREAKD